MLFRFLLILLAFPIVLSAQRPGQFSSKEYLSLTDEVKILSVFVETPEGNWEDDEIDYTLKEYAAARDWIVTEAEYYGQQLEFDEDYFSRDNGSVIFLDKTPIIGQSPTKTTNAVLDKLNYRDLEAFMSYNRVTMKEDKFKILLFVKSNNRSHAFNYWSMADVDLAIVYCRSTYGMITDRYVIIHELLHQFGAWDLYMGRSQTETSAQNAIERWPFSIMINTHQNKGELIVDELTAWCIGWAEYDPSYAEFNPVKNREIKKKEIKIDPSKTVLKIRPRKKDPSKEKETGGG
ncbi:hypothetical protein [Neolewinella persica]|uniref:hypothetical protein n=1 Tax=Neolewinella persica TaxID=70998 RepID=UPI00039B9F07|nr:hypothetical protein [Neolewinella persica]